MTAGDACIDVVAAKITRATASPVNMAVALQTALQLLNIDTTKSWGLVPLHTRAAGNTTQSAYLCYYIEGA